MTETLDYADHDEDDFEAQILSTPARGGTSLGSALFER